MKCTEPLLRVYPGEDIPERMASRYARNALEAEGFTV